MMWNTSFARTEASGRPDAMIVPAVARLGPKRSAVKWVGNGSARRGRHKAHAPSDFDDPKPDPFLAPKDKFYVALSCNAGTPEQKEQWAALAMELLLQAVADWGAGGKTSSGYGRMA
jgi:hypothetical protein